MRRKHDRKFISLRPLVLAGAAAALLAGWSAAPALADDWGRGDERWEHREWREHEWREDARRAQEWREHEWRERHAYYGPRYYVQPGYVYAPPPVVYPPPAYVEPGLNLGFYFR